MKYVQTFSRFLDGTNQLATFRICHWDPTFTHILPNAKIKVRFEVRPAGLETVAVEVKDLYQATGNPGQFNPGSVLRNLDRSLGNLDAINLVDENTAPDLTQGETIWQEVGAVNKIVSPEFELLRNDDRELTLVLSRVSNDIGVTVNIFVEF